MIYVIGQFINKTNLLSLTLKYARNLFFLYIQCKVLYCTLRHKKSVTKPVNNRINLINLCDSLNSVQYKGDKHCKQ